MQSFIIDLLLCGFIYAILLAFIFIRENKDRRNKGSDSDDEGGLPVFNPPDIDLPPGVCLPDDPKVNNREPDEVFV